MTEPSLPPGYYQVKLLDTWIIAKYTTKNEWLMCGNEKDVSWLIVEIGDFL